MKRYNHEKRAWKGKSHKKGGERVRDLRDKAQQAVCPHCGKSENDLEAGRECSKRRLRGF